MASLERRRARVVIGLEALEQLKAAAPSDVLVVMDGNTREAVGARVAELLGDAPVFVFDERHGLHAGLEEAERVRSRLPAGVTPVAVGSGVITDIVRYAAHRSDRDFISVPTAASMDGYSSAVAAMQIQGVKVTYPARAPVGIYADPRVLANAPAELTRAGIGDLLGKVTAGVDWLAAHLLYGERYDADIASDIRSAMMLVAGEVPQLLDGEPAAQRDLIDCLILSGEAIERFGNSRPASGSEHHASHFWDLLAARGLREHGSHGLQVGYATGFCMRLQELAYATDARGLREPVPAQDPLGPDARDWIGTPTRDIVEAVARKQRLVSSVRDTWPSHPRAWQEVREALAYAMAPFALVRHGLEQAGFRLDAGFLGIDREMLRATLRHATRLRDRYTVLDFLEGQQQLDRAIDVTVPRANKATGGEPDAVARS